MTYDYIHEAKRAHIIKFEPKGKEGRLSTVDTTGHYDLEWNPLDEPEARYLADFIEAFGGRFERVHLDLGDVAKKCTPEPWSAGVVEMKAFLCHQVESKPFVRELATSWKWRG